MAQIITIPEEILRSIDESIIQSEIEAKQRAQLERNRACTRRWNRKNIDRLKVLLHEWYEKNKHDPEFLKKRAQQHAAWQRKNKDRLNAKRRKCKS